MSRKRGNALKISAVLFAAALFFGACSSDDSDSDGDQEGDPGESPTSLLDDEIEVEGEGGVDVSVDDGEIDVTEE